VGRRLEAAQDLGVDVDTEITVVYQLFISGLHSLEHPVRKWLLNERVCQVYEPLPRQTFVLILMRQILLHIWILQGFLQYFSNTKAFIMWHREIANSVTMHKLLCTLDELLEKVNSVALIWSEVCFDLHSQEMIPKKTVSNYIETYTSLFERYLAANV
jgi:hypothetical protein